MSTMTSNQIIALAAAVTAVATVGLVTFALVQWRSLQRSVSEASKTRSAQVLLKIYDIMTALRPKWHQLYGLSGDFTSWEGSDKDVADYVCVELQRVAFLCEKRLVDSEFVMDGYAKVFVQSWEKLEGYVKSYRAQSGEPETIEDGAFQRKHLETFTQRCRDYLGKRCIPAQDTGAA